MNGAFFGREGATTLGKFDLFSPALLAHRERFAEMKVDPGEHPGIQTPFTKTNLRRAIPFSECTT